MKQGYPTLFSLQHVYPKYSEKAPILCQVLPPTLEASGKNNRFLRLPLSLNIIFLLSLWEFHIMHPGHIHFPVLPGSSPTLVTCPPNKRRGKKIQIVSSIYSLEHDQIPCVQALKENRVLPHSYPHQKPSIVKSYT